jgi:RNA polymerase sigma-70 factor (ECF subfamily)
VSVACAQAVPDADATLAEALACDVDRAFEDVVIAYRSQVVTFVARMLRDDARAEDVAQDVFVRAHRALHGYPAERRAGLRLRSWLLAIAHNLTRNAVRDAPPPSDSLDYDDGAPRAAMSDDSPSPDDVVLRAETWQSIGDAVARLTPALRGAFVMRYVDDLSYDEIAETLGQPVGTVKASAHRGLLAVRAQLEKNDV